MPEAPQSRPNSETFLLSVEQAKIVGQLACPPGQIKKLVIVGTDQEDRTLIETQCVLAAT